MQDETGPQQAGGNVTKDADDIYSKLRPLVPLPFALPEEPVGIAEMANIFRVTHRTLHFYEEKGLVSPKRIGHMRAYTHNDISEMAVINAFREVGVSVATIQDVMKEIRAAGPGEEARQIFHDAMRTRKRELTAELSTIRRQIQQINDILAMDDRDISEAGQDAVELSDIERKCLELMAEGYAAARLARAIDVSPEELHRLESGIIRKFDANNRFQAVAKAVLLGIIAA